MNCDKQKTSLEALVIDEEPLSIAKIRIFKPGHS